MSYQRSFLRSVAITVIGVALLGSGVSLLAPVQETSSGALTTTARAASNTTHGLVGVSAVDGAARPTAGEQFTLTSDGQ